MVAHVKGDKPLRVGMQKIGKIFTIRFNGWLTIWLKETGNLEEEQVQEQKKNNFMLK